MVMVLVVSVLDVGEMSRCKDMSEFVSETARLVEAPGQ